MLPSGSSRDVTPSAVEVSPHIATVAKMLLAKHILERKLTLVLCSMNDVYRCSQLLCDHPIYLHDVTEYKEQWP